MEVTAAKESKTNVGYIILSIFLWSVTVFWMLIVVLLSTSIHPQSSSYSQDILHNLNSYIHLNISTDHLHLVDHLFGFGLIAFLSYVALSAMDHVRNYESVMQQHPDFLKSRYMVHSFLSLCMTLVFSVCIEYAQIYISDKQSSIYDVLRDLAGIVFVLVLIRLVLLMVLIVDFIRRKRKNDK